MSQSIDGFTVTGLQGVAPAVTTAGEKSKRVLLWPMVRYSSLNLWRNRQSGGAHNPKGYRHINLYRIVNVNALYVLAESNRGRLINAWNRTCPHSPARCAEVLTEHAVAQGYVKPRSPVKGSVLVNWAKKGDPPAWACQAALDLVMATGEYQPRDRGEWAALVYYWLKGRADVQTLDAVLASFPAYLDKDKLLPWVQRQLGS